VFYEKIVFLCLFAFYGCFLSASSCKPVFGVRVASERLCGEIIVAEGKTHIVLLGFEVAQDSGERNFAELDYWDEMPQEDGVDQQVREGKRLNIFLNPEKSLILTIPNHIKYIRNYNLEDVRHIAFALRATVEFGSLLYFISFLRAFSKKLVLPISDGGSIDGIVEAEEFNYSFEGGSHPRLFRLFPHTRVFLPCCSDILAAESVDESDSPRGSVGFMWILNDGDLWLCCQ